MYCSLRSEYFPSAFSFPFLFVGSAAKAFETLKKKYSRKHINFQKSSRSGTGTRDTETEKKELKEFSFLRWLDSFIRPWKTKTKIPELSMEINESSNAGDELKSNGYGSDESENAGFNAMTDGTEIMGTVLDVMRDVSKVLNKRLTSMNYEKQDDEDDLLGKLVAAELKSLPQRQKYRLKHEINNPIFNYKLQNENVNHSPQSADKILSPTFHTEVNRSFQNAGHWYNDMQKYDIMITFSCVSLYND